MDKLVKHAIRMLEIVEGENDFFRNDAKRQADIARAVYDTILRVQVLERKARKTESSSEIPNNCEHITEDGVTCAKYPACDDCLDNPLNKVKGSERLVKGSEQTEPTISKMEQVDKDINVRSKDEPQTCFNCRHNVTKHTFDHACGGCTNMNRWEKDEPQSLEQFRVGLEYHTDTTHFGKTKGESVTTNKFEDEPQTEEEYINNLPWTEVGNGEQTETEIAKAIVHKMIDDAVIAEDAYPDLRQKMHDAVDEYEPQTDCAWK